MNIAFETQGGSSERQNEDWVAATPDTVIVLDGVTAPRVDKPGCHHSVTWFTESLGSRLLMLLRGDTGIDRALADAIKQVNKLHQDTCKLYSPGVPAAAVAVLRRRGDYLEYLVLADAAIVLDTDMGIKVISDDRVTKAAPEALATTRRTEIGTPEHEAAVSQMSVEQLKRRNVRGGYWVASTNAEAAEQALTGRITASKVHRVAIFTDGASRAVDTFGEMDWPACLDYLDEHGPRGLIGYIRKLEDGDPSGEKWPRFKKSDDATVAVIQT